MYYSIYNNNDIVIHNNRAVNMLFDLITIMVFMNIKLIFHIHNINY